MAHSSIFCTNCSNCIHCPYLRLLRHLFIPQSLCGLFSKLMSITPLSYKDAGVDIDAGDALVERIKPLAKKTMREGVLAGIGGFGALF